MPARVIQWTHQRACLLCKIVKTTRVWYCEYFGEHIYLHRIRSASSVKEVAHILTYTIGTSFSVAMPVDEGNGQTMNAWRDMSKPWHSPCKYEKSGPDWRLPLMLMPWHIRNVTRLNAVHHRRWYTKPNEKTNIVNGETPCVARRDKA